MPASKVLPLLLGTRMIAEPPPPKVLVASFSTVFPVVLASKVKLPAVGLMLCEPLREATYVVLSLKTSEAPGFSVKTLPPDGLALVPDRVRVPESTVNPPVRLSDAVKIRLPAPILVRAYAPLIGPLRVILPLAPGT